MASETKRNQVSCVALTFFYDWLKAHGIARRVIQDGLPYSPDHLENRLNWIDYATFCEIERRIAVLFPDDPDLFFHIGQSLGATRSLSFIRVLLRSVTSPFQVYSQIPRLVRTFLFPWVSARFERVSRTAIRARYVFDPDTPATDAFLQTVRGMLASIPTMMGAPEARVRLTRVSSHEALYEVDVVSWEGPGLFLETVGRRLVGVARMRWRNFGEAAAELEETNALLQDKVKALTEAKTALDRKVRELSILNRLARAATSELDVQRLLAKAVSVIARELDGAPVAVLLSEPPGPWKSAESDGFSEDELRRIEGLLTEGGLAPGLSSGPRRIVRQPAPGRCWVVLPMHTREQLVGVLVLGAEREDEYEYPLLEAMAGQLAVALDNAVSYRLIDDLRETLDVRVRVRTAELEHARGQLEDTVRRLERSDRAQRDFFTSVSHELKTPLTLILAPLEDLEAELRARVDGGDTAERLRPIRSNAIALLRLVSELLDFARLDGDRMPLDPRDLELAGFLAEVVEDLRPLATRKAVTLTYERPSAPVEVLADPLLLRRVIVNLVANAVKYVASGDHVEVRLAATEDGATFEVVDDGPGIARADHARIFERFQRVRDARGRVVEGSGIGLAMVKEIVQLHGGQIELRSEVGQGSTFRVRLPRAHDELRAAVGLAPSAAPSVSPTDLRDLFTEPDLVRADIAVEPASAPRAPASPNRVLLVEDNPDMRGFLAQVLGRYHTVLQAADGEEALAIARRELPDVILSDVMMPRMNGYELCRRLKADPATRNLPVLLITARHGTEAALEGFSAGADDFVVKPFSVPELVARIGAQLRIRALTMTLMRVEKQTALGIMSAGIAHEVLNPVNAIVNAVPPLRRICDALREGRASARDPETASALLRAVEHSGQRIRNVVDAILTFARRDDDHLRLQERRPSEGISSVLAILGYRIHDHVTIHRELRYDEPVLAYHQLLDQVVMNLVVNAIDALKPGGGNVWVETDREGDTLVVRVRDDGPGVPAADRERIFTPFYTTKAPGVGTGLGLAISREIAALHRGTLELAGAARGADFVLRLPLLADASPPGAQGGASSPPIPAAVRP